MKWILHLSLMCLPTIGLIAQKAPNSTIFIHAQNPTQPFPDSYFYSIGAGRANEGLRADWQNQLKHIQQHFPFKFLRFHGLFADDMGVYFEDNAGQPIFNFQYIDVLFDFLLSQNIKPFVEFGFMPKLLASTPQTIFWWNANISFPNNEKKWQSLIEATVHHWINRYGIEEVQQWYFEVWNEPNLKDLFFSGDQKDYFKLYQLTVESVKKIHPSLKVGGPATAGMAWISDFIDFCVENNVPVDFISTHHYGVKSGFLDHLGIQTTILHEDPLAIAHAVKKSREEIKQSKLPHLSLHFTEWSSSYTPRDPFHDSYLSAAYILNQLKGVDTLAKNMSYWTFTDIFEENGPRYTPFHGGFGLLNYQSIPKPAYFAYKYLATLGKNRLPNDHPNTLVGKLDDGGINILTWDYSHRHPSDTIGNQHYYNQDLPTQKMDARVFEIDQLPTGRYHVSVYKTGYQNNDAYTAYLKLGSPQQLTRDQVDYLMKKANDDPLIMKFMEVSQLGKIKLEIPMNKNEIVLITIKKL